MLIPDGYAQANFMHSGANAPSGAQCTLGFDISAFVGSIQLAAQTISDAWADEIMPSLTDDLQYDGVLLKYGPNDTGPSVIHPDATAGSDAAASSVPNTCYLIHKHTNFGGRRGRGRLYLPGVAENATADNGSIDGGKVDALSTRFDAFYLLLTGSDLVPVVLHGTSAPTPYPITSFSVDTLAATQRRRLRR